MESVSKRGQLREAFAHLDRLVDGEGYLATRWILQIRTALDYLLDVETSDAEAVHQARRIFVDMHSGGRNFSDFFPWCEDEAGRRLANREFGSAKSRIWILLGTWTIPGRHLLIARWLTSFRR